MKSQRSIRATQGLVALWVWAGTVVTGGAASPPGPTMVPLGLERAVSTTGRAAQSSADPSVQGVADALRGVVQGMARQRAATVRLTRPQRQATQALSERMGAAVDLHLRAPDGTPRAIRGSCLERAHGNWLDGDAATARGFLRNNRALLRLDDPDSELQLGDRTQDALGRRQLRFQQRHRGVPVWPSEVIVHLNAAGDVDALDGGFAATPAGLAVAPRQTAAGAVALARAAVPDGTDTEATEALLVVHARAHATPRLAWRVRLARGLDVRWLVVVDDADGTILTTLNEVMDADVAGSGPDLFAQSRSLRVWSEAGNHFLVDTSKPMFDLTSNPPSASTTRGAIIVLDARNGKPDNSGSLPLSQITSASPLGPWLRDGVSAAFGLAQTFDYFSTAHARNSLDGNGGTMLGVVRFDQNFQNAFWNGQLMVFGDGAPYAGALDVVAHELTHGVTQHSANLQYQNQSGALNEAMSDVFGEATEARTLGQNDWLLGASLGTPLRNMMDPHALTIGNTGRPYPKNLSELIGPNDPFLDQFRGRDSGGVHLNSSIINHAFYQLADGLPAALGIGEAARIFYRALTTHLVSTSEFIDARLAAVRSAEELFGAGDVKVQRVREAFDAVGILDGNPTPGPDPFPGTEGADSLVFLYNDPNSGNSFLGRRESAFGDPASGVGLGSQPAAPRRPAVTGGGVTAAYITASFDVCFVDTDDPSSEVCTNRPGQINSIALSPDAQYAGLVLRDQNGPRDEITVVELRDGGGSTTYPLRAPSYDDGSFDTVAFASEMDFSADNRLLLYDAFNQVSLVADDPFTAWSIYALDIAQDATYVIVQPTDGLDIGNPSLAQRSDDHVVFDAFAPGTGVSTIYAGQLSTGTAEVAGTVTGDVGAPGYTGDDGAIVYTVPDNGVPSAHSLVLQPLANDRITPSGAASPLLGDGYFGVVYRRGLFRGPSACASDLSCTDGDACTTDRCDAAAGCQHTPRTGPGAVVCLFPSPPLLNACQGTPGYSRIGPRLELGRNKIDQADQAPRPKRARALLRQGVRLVGKAAKLARKLARQGATTTDCRDAVRTFFDAVRSQAAGG